MPNQFWQVTVLTGCLIHAASLLAADQPAELVVVNGKVATLDAASTLAQAVAIRDGKILAVGTDEEVRKLVDEKTRVIDAEGHLVVPGIMETHVHATGAARGEVTQPFVQLGSIGEIQDWVRARVKESPEAAWIRLPRVDVTRIRERRMPNRTELDTAAPNNPAVFTWQYANRQVQIINSKALQVAEITRETQAPKGGKLHFDDAGEPTGMMENCSQLLAKHLPTVEVPEAAYLDSLESLLRRYNELGITSIFERSSNATGFQTYQKLKAEDRLPVRVTVTIGLSTDGTVAGTERAIQALPFKHGDGDDWVRVGPLKLGVDGGVLYGTAFLREPYGESAFSLYGISDPNYRGDLRISPENLKNIIRTGHRLGWQMSSHVTGDAGVDAVLGAVEAANADSPIRDRRYTLIHAYFANQEAAERAARLGVCVDTQPAWYYKDGDALADALGQFRLQQFIGLDTWKRAGVKVALNSDHMQGFDPNSSLNPYNPFLTMYTAVSRKTETGLLIGPDQRVSRETALRMMTSDAAWFSFDEEKKGTIEVGKLGDLAILSDDLLTCDEERIKEIHALTTIVGGSVVYEAKQQTAYFPPSESQGGWRKLDVSADVQRLAGMNPQKLQELKDWLLQSDDRDFAAVVIRNGYIVLEVERGNSAKTDSRRVASVSKAVCATVLAIASERSQQGLTPRKMSFDDPAFDFIPWAQPLSDPRKASITVKQLLNHTSGICPEALGAKNDGSWEYVLGLSGDERTAKLAFDPGTACGYSTHALAHAALVCETVTGQSYDEFAIAALLKPIGCEHWWFQFYEGGSTIGRHPSHGFGVPARDLARIAYCMLHDGRWEDQQVIPQWFVEQTAAPTHDVTSPEMRFGINAQTFSHGWQIPALRGGEGFSNEGIPADARHKPGSGGQLIAFVPSLDLVLARQTGSSGGWEYEEFVRRACQAVHAEARVVAAR